MPQGRSPPVGARRGQGCPPKGVQSGRGSTQLLSKRGASASQLSGVISSPPVPSLLGGEGSEPLADPKELPSQLMVPAPAGQERWVPERIQGSRQDPRPRPDTREAGPGWGELTSREFRDTPGS